MQRTFAQLFGLDTRSLAAFRIAISGVLLVDLAIRWPDRIAHYTDAGILPRSDVQAIFPSLYMLGGGALLPSVLLVLTALAAVALVLGFYTRVANVACWLLLASLQERNPLILNGGDYLHTLLLFWAMFLPLGARWSLDSVLRRRGAPRPERIATPASACIVVQLCLVYWMAAYFKCNATWLEGKGVLHALTIQSYTRPLADSLFQLRGLLYWLSLATVAWEFAGPVLLLIPYRTGLLRMVAIVGFAMLHLGIELVLSVGLFSYITMAAWLLLLPSQFWRAIGLGGEPSPATLADSEAAAEPGAAPRGRWTRRLGWLAQGVCGVLLVYVVLWNIQTTKSRLAKVLPGEALYRFGRALHLTQNWGVYRAPTGANGWTVAAGLLEDGRVVDLLRGGKLFVYGRADRAALRYKTHRWRKLCWNLVDEDNTRYRAGLCRWLMSDWNRAHGPDQQVIMLDLYWLEDETPNAEDPGNITQLLLHREQLASQGAFFDTLNQLEAGAGTLP